MKQHNQEKCVENQTLNIIYQNVRYQENHEIIWSKKRCRKNENPEKKNIKKQGTRKIQEDI